MVARPAYEHAPEANPGGWQSIRQQLFGHQRERDAEDQLLTLLTQSLTRLGAAVGAAAGPLRSPPVRASALRALEEGLNSLVTWHGAQVQAARAGGWQGAAPDLAEALLGPAQASYPLFETVRAAAGRIDCADLVQGVSHLRGTESDAYFNEALDGLIFLLNGAYSRLLLDEPTAPTAAALESTWAVLLDEVRALACPPAPAAVEAEADAGAAWLEAPAPVTPVEPSPADVADAAAAAPAAEATGSALAAGAGAGVQTPDVATPDAAAQTPAGDVMVLPARFHRLELVELVQLVELAHPVEVAA
jgi:hypothetical protein